MARNLITTSPSITFSNCYRQRGVIFAFDRCVVICTSVLSKDGGSIYHLFQSLRANKVKLWGSENACKNSLLHLQNVFQTYFSKIPRMCFSLRLVSALFCEFKWSANMLMSICFWFSFWLSYGPLTPNWFSVVSLLLQRRLRLFNFARSFLAGLISFEFKVDVCFFVSDVYSPGYQSPPRSVFVFFYTFFALDFIVSVVIARHICYHVNCCLDDISLYILVARLGGEDLRVFDYRCTSHVIVKLLLLQICLGDASV